jgi:hypothetical protein
MTTRRELLTGAAVAVAVAALPSSLPAAVAVAAEAPPALDLKAWALENGYGGLRGEHIFLADGVEDCCDSCRTHYNDPPTPTGTLMVYYRCSYEYDEWETTCLQCLYDNWFHWQNLTDEDVKKMLGNEA